MKRANTALTQMHSLVRRILASVHLQHWPFLCRLGRPTAGQTNSPTLNIVDSHFLQESRTHLWNFIFQALPEVAAVNGLAHVGEDGVLLEGPHGVGVCLHVCSWGNTEESGFRVDGTQLSFVIEAHPSNVIA